MTPVPERRVCRCSHGYLNHAWQLKRAQPCGEYLASAVDGLVRCECRSFEDRRTVTVDTGGKT